MTLLLPTLGVAFAAFCVWLTVRIVNRRERWAKWMAVGLSIVVPFSLYAVAYISIVQVDGTFLWWKDEPTTPIALFPDYSGKSYPPTEPPLRDQETWERFFAPAHWIDRKLRPSEWIWVPSPPTGDRGCR